MTGTKRRFVWLGVPSAVVVGCLLAIFAIDTIAAGGVSLVAATGGAAPGGGSYGSLDEPMVNQNGDVAFAAYSGAAGIYKKPYGSAAVAVARPEPASLAWGS